MRRGPNPRATARPNRQAAARDSASVTGRRHVDPDPAALRRLAARPQPVGCQPDTRAAASPHRRSGPGRGNRTGARQRDSLGQPVCCPSRPSSCSCPASTVVTTPLLRSATSTVLSRWLPCGSERTVRTSVPSISALLGPASTTAARPRRARSNWTWAVSRSTSRGGSVAAAPTTMTSCAWASLLRLMVTNPPRLRAVSRARASGSRSSTEGEATEGDSATTTLRWVCHGERELSGQPRSDSVTASARAGSRLRAHSELADNVPAVATRVRSVTPGRARRHGHHRYRTSRSAPSITWSPAARRGRRY